MTIAILDGGMGQELIARSPDDPTPLWSTRVMLDYPHLVREVHDDYFASGADIATTNTYAVLRDRLAKHGIEDQFESLHAAACDIATQSRDAQGTGRVAGSLGPLGWSYRADMAPPPDLAAELYAEIVSLQKSRVDLFIAETVCGLDQARGVLRGVKDTNKPVWLAVSVSDETPGVLRNGDPVEAIFDVIEAEGADAILINCSTPEAVSHALPLIAGKGLPVGAYANGFTRITDAFAKGTTSVDLLDARKDLGPVEYADFAERWVELGATIIGGCCEVGPAHIAEVKRRLS